MLTIRYRLARMVPGRKRSSSGAVGLDLVGSGRLGGTNEVWVGWSSEFVGIETVYTFEGSSPAVNERLRGRLDDGAHGSLRSGHARVGSIGVYLVAAEFGLREL